jgi:predicted amidohydrolase
MPGKYALFYKRQGSLGRILFISQSVPSAATSGQISPPLQASIAGKLGLWVVLGSTHQLTGTNKPHNSLYLINMQGKIVDRYDKRFCTKGDLRRLTPGDHFVYFTINKVKCSLLICFDLRFPEIYRELYKQKVNCIFQCPPKRAKRAYTYHAADDAGSCSDQSPLGEHVKCERLLCTVSIVFHSA